MSPSNYPPILGNDPVKENRDAEWILLVVELRERIDELTGERDEVNANHLVVREELFAALERIKGLSAELNEAYGRIARLESRLIGEYKAGCDSGGT